MNDSGKLPSTFTRRRTVLGGAALLASTLPGVRSADAAASFSQWVETFRPRALAKVVSNETYSRVMQSLKPDTSVYALDRAQPEFNEETWQYINRRVSDWRISTGRERLRQHAPLLSRLERDYGVDRHILLGLWGMESAFGDLVDNPKHMRAIFPALAALAWGDARRRKYWEQELINALRIVERGWAQPREMIGSWAGAMGHTQWMPEVWLAMGVDYDQDGRISPFGKPDDALAGTCRYLASRGKYQRGQAWGVEVRAPGRAAGLTSAKSPDAFGVSPAKGGSLPPLGATARLWVPVAGGPAFLLGRNFYAVRSYNPSMNYTLAIVHLADRIRGEGYFVQQFPGGERPLTLAELQEVQTRLTASGFDTGGTDGRVGNDTMRAVRAFQQRAGIEPADGYASLKVLARLRGQ
jgi:membrane-bound lytic murein transglycosylase B